MTFHKVETLYTKLSNVEAYVTLFNQSEHDILMSSQPQYVCPTSHHLMYHLKKSSIGPYNFTELHVTANQEPPPMAPGLLCL